MSKDVAHVTNVKTYNKMSTPVKNVHCKTANNIKNVKCQTCHKCQHSLRCKTFRIHTHVKHVKCQTCQTTIKTVKCQTCQTCKQCQISNTSKQRQTM